jgi:hypothetical protein
MTQSRSTECVDIAAWVTAGTPFLTIICICSPALLAACWLRAVHDAERITARMRRAWRWGCFATLIVACWSR